MDVFNGANLYLIVNFVIAMSFAGTSAAISDETAFCAASYEG